MESIWRDESIIESWLPIQGYEEYQVSDFGRVKRGGRILEPYRGNRYLQVGLWKNGVEKTKLIHRLVALAFLPNPESKPTVNHLNEIKHDNRLENLDWETRSKQILWSPPPVGASGHRYIRMNESGTYSVHIRRNNKEIYYKSFALLEEAKKARDEFLKSL